jgi:hypothetical protein
MGIKNVLGSQWNTLTPGKEVKKLLSKTPNVITKLKETDVIDADSILKTPAKEAVTTNTEAVERVKVIMAKITSRITPRTRPIAKT